MKKLNTEYWKKLLETVAFSNGEISLYELVQKEHRHFHTTGSLLPSREDNQITDRMNQICGLMGIKLIDHVIIGPRDEYYSFHENSVLPLPSMKFAYEPQKIKLEGMKVAETVLLEKKKQMEVSFTVFLKTYKSIFSEAIPDFSPDELPLDTFIEEVITMRHIISLKAALDANNSVEMLTQLLSLLLCYTAKTREPGNTETECFNNLFYEYIERNYDVHLVCIMKLEDVYEHDLNDFLNDLYKYAHADKANRWLQLPLKLEKYKYMNNCTWQNYHDIITKLLKEVTISSNNELSELNYSIELSKELLVSCGITDTMLQRAAVTCLADHFNSQTMLITPELRYEDKHLTSDWKITSLLEAMYMELSVSFAPNTQIKKCANPTCNNFFDLGVGNSRKIYCSNRCGMLMAKRKQRERDKQKSLSKI